ncbi:MAG TPA: carbamoyl phosphate synthase large subunit [Pseudogracilibacillus sp.]|nr:carbamoyl phosphate synthase large subunit [Pseudogracilibacillus sp.]
MPKDKEIKKVLVIGSGPIVIGQAAEFDYAGTQACLTLKEEGTEVILLNNNPATIMTDDKVADKVYFEPLTSESVTKIIQKERPDGMLATVSGQTGLNLAFTLQEKGILQQYDVKVLGTPIEAIMNGEDREKFRSLMHEMEQPIPESRIIENMDDAIDFLEKVDLPIIIRPAYTLGGSGGGIAKTNEEFIQFVTSGLRASPIHQCLIEKSIAGWKEIEFEVVCDAKKQAVSVCHMENIDPVGVHTGDSIVVAPIQTLEAHAIHMLKDASLTIVRELGIIGACNVQLAYHPKTNEYRVIEVNPRVSRSSALASKATGYPIAKIAAKLGLGYHLDEVYHAGAEETLATFEPKFDYKVVKFPAWPFDKLTDADRTLGTQMKATGEVMAVEKTVAAGLQKAIRSLELPLNGLSLPSVQSLTDDQLKQLLTQPDDRRFFAVTESFERGFSVESLYDLTNIDYFFLGEIKQLVSLRNLAALLSLDVISEDNLLLFKQYGFTNRQLAELWEVDTKAVQEKLQQFSIQPVYEAIKGYQSSSDEKAAYYYATWKQGNSSYKETAAKKVLIVGSGPIRIGQGIEFDYCSVQGIQALQKAGYETILMNNNPATVSTDYSLADKLYFEPVTAEDVLYVLEKENTNRVIVQFGGQTAINLANELEAAGVQMLGSNMDTIDMLEDRDRFYEYMNQVGVAHIPGLTAYSEIDVYEKAAKIGYPVLIRPSYVIGGQGMAILEDEMALRNYLEAQIATVSYPILLDAYYPGKEVEVDVVTDGNNIVIPAIFEHVEKAGVHSGDSMAITPPISLSEANKSEIVAYSESIAKGMDFKGIFNIQFVIYKDSLFVLEVNPRASRTVPIVSKVTNVNMIELATAALLDEVVYDTFGLLAENDFYTVKAPVFSNNKLPGVDPLLVPEMKSTGEVISIADKFSDSLKKAFIWNETFAEAFMKNDKEILIKSKDPYFIHVTERFKELGIELVEDMSTEETIKWLQSNKALALFNQETNQALRELALTNQVIVMSAEETVRAFSMMSDNELNVKAIQHYQINNEKEVILK